MRLLSLQLTNIRSYTNAFMEFPEGVLLLEGDIGCGKSTIMMAIEFALFGLGDIDGTSLVRLGEQTGTVILRFEIDGKEYEIERNLVQKGGRFNQDKCSIKINGDRQQMGVEELKLMVLDILQFNEPPSSRSKSVIYRYAVFTPQEEMKAIIFKDPDDRLNTLRKAFSLEDYQNVQKNMEPTLKKLSIKIGQKEPTKKQQSETANTLQANSEAIQKSQQTHADLTQTKHSLETTIAALQQKQTEANAQLTVLQQKQATISQISQQLKLNTGMKTRLENDIATLQRNLTESSRTRTENGRKVEKMHTEIMALLPTVKNFNQYSEALFQDRILEKTEELTRAKAAQEEKESEAKAAIESMATIKSTIQTVKDLSLIIEKTEGKCPTCNQDLPPSTKNQILENNSAALKKFEKNLQFQHERQSKITLVVKQATLETERLTAEVQQLRINLEQYKNFRKQMESAEDQITKAGEQITEAEKSIAAKQEEVRTITALIEQNTAELNTMNELMTQIEALKMQQRTIDLAIQEDRERLTAITQKIGETVGGVQKLKEQSGQLQQDQEKLTQTLLQIGQAEEYHTWLTETFTDALKQIEQQVFQYLNAEFNTYFRHFFSMLIQDATKDAKIDEKFTPIVTQDGYDLAIEYLSGGERTSVALSYRLALNMIIQRVAMSLKANILIFDEPTDGFSTPQLYKFRDLLAELGCPQIILVSHQKELETCAQTIYRIDKQDGISKIIS